MFNNSPPIFQYLFIFSFLRYHKLFTEHMLASCLNELPESFRSLESNRQDNSDMSKHLFFQIKKKKEIQRFIHFFVLLHSTVPRPNLDTHVFCKAHESVGTIQLREFVFPFRFFFFFLYFIYCILCFIYLFVCYFIYLFIYC